MAIESALVTKIGDAGQKLHTGRSRNDQVATDLRLWMRDEVEVLLTRGDAVADCVCQAGAQVYRGYYADVYAFAAGSAGDDRVVSAELCGNAGTGFQPAERLPGTGSMSLRWGPGAVAGSTLPLDRDMTAAALGFRDIKYNSIDAVSDRDFCAEFIFCCSLVSTHLSRLAEDWILYTSAEFSFITTDDAYCTSSSMMPQKRNPDMLELIRGKTGTVYGALVAMLTIMKAQPSTYNRDLQEDKIHVFAAADTTDACLRMTAAIVSHTAL